MICFKPNSRAQNRLGWFIFGSSIIAFVFSVVAIGHCSFVSRKCSSGECEVQKRQSVQGLGAFSFKFEDLGARVEGCIRYSSDMKDQFEGPEKSARAFGTIAALCTGLAMVLAVITHLFVKRHNKLLWLTLRVLFVIATFSQALTFTLLGSSVCDVGECQLGVAGIVCVLNVLLLTAISVVSWIVPPALHPVFSVAPYGARVAAGSLASTLGELPKAIPEWDTPYQETARVTAIEDCSNGGHCETVDMKKEHVGGSHTITTTNPEWDMPYQETERVTTTEACTNSDHCEAVFREEEQVDGSHTFTTADEEEMLHDISLV